MSERTLTLIKDNDIRWVDLRFTDTMGKENTSLFPPRRWTRIFSKRARCLTAHLFPVGRASTNQT